MYRLLVVCFIGCLSGTFLTCRDHNRSVPSAKGRVQGLYPRSALDVFPVLEDQRWAWGMGTPMMLLRGHFAKDKGAVRGEDVVIVAEAVVRRGWPWQHFFVLRSPGRSPSAIVVPKIGVSPTLRGFRWGQKIQRPTSAQAADFDGDGHLDVAVAYANGRVAIFRGDGKGERWQLAHILSCERLWAFQRARLLVGHWDSDGRLDVLLVGPSGHVMLWRQHRKGAFQSSLLLRGHASLPADYERRLQQWPRPSQAVLPKGKVARPVVRGVAASRPTSRPVSRRVIPTIAGLKRVEQGLLASLNGDGRPDLLLAGRDVSGRVWLWPVLQGPKGQGELRVGARRPLPLRWSSDSPMAGAKMLIHRDSEKGADGPALSVLTSAYGHLNHRGVAIVRRYRYAKDSAASYPYLVGQQRIFASQSLSHRLVAGRFGAPGLALVMPREVRVWTEQRGFRGGVYGLHRDPVIRGRITLRGAVGCALDGKDDALVMLGVGALRKKDPLGIHLLIHRKPLIRPTRPADRPRSR